MAKPAAPIIIKRKKVVGGGHHGGSWKVAYADFVTAMMAFFLVLWLITALDKDQRAALFDYFKNPSLEQGKSVRAAPAQMGPGGASTSPINLRGGLDAPRTAMASKITVVDTTGVREEDAKRIKAEAEAAEHKKLESLMAELQAAIEKSEALQPFKDQLLLDITPEGLRIQIVDKQNRPMFDVGSARLKDYTQEILHTLADYLNSVPNHISLSGHTDVRPYPGSGGGYSNWELSTDRANAARRSLQEGGLLADKVSRVVGLSSTVLFDRDDPENPVNRRISIIVMTKEAEDSARKTDERQQDPVAASTPAQPEAPGITVPGAVPPRPAAAVSAGPGTGAPAAQVLSPQPAVAGQLKTVPAPAVASAPVAGGPQAAQQKPVQTALAAPVAAPAL